MLNFSNFLPMRESHILRCTTLGVGVYILSMCHHLPSAKSPAPAGRRGKVSRDAVIIISPLIASPAVKTTRGRRGAPSTGECYK